MNLEKLKPVGISWVITEALLFVVTWYNVITVRQLGNVGIIFSLSLAVYFIAYLISREKRNEEKR